MVDYRAKPGYTIAHHVHNMHGSTSDASKRDRAAFALRHALDDVRHLEREGARPDWQNSDALEHGNSMDSDEFPLIWTADQRHVSA